MGTIKQHFDADVMQYSSTAASPRYTRVTGTSFPITFLRFSATTEEMIYVRFRAINYGTGNWTALIGWYADTATSGGVTWGISVAAITANTDTQDVETKTFDTETLITDTHLGTTGQRAHDVVGTLSTINSVAPDDWVVMRIARKVADAGDTMTGFANLISFDLSYSDT